MHTIAALKHLVDELTACSKRILEYSRNTSATGLHRERIVESYIKKISPSSFSTGSGFIHGHSESSRQIDIIIYNTSDFSPLFDEGGYVVVTPHSVVHAIEVKSRLNKKELFSSFENIISATSMNKKIHGVVFGFDGLSSKQAFKHIEEFVRINKSVPNLQDLLPRIILCLNKWVILSGKKDGEFTYAHFHKMPFEEQFLLFFSQIYYRLYGYRRKLSSGLPKLEEQGFPIRFPTKGTYESLRIAYK